MDFSLFDFGVEEDFNNYDDNAAFDDYDSMATTGYSSAGTTGYSSVGTTGYSSAGTTGYSSAGSVAPTASQATQQAALWSKSKMCCETCGSTSFKNVDGTYICKVCGTMSHNYIETMQDMEWAEASTMGFLSSRLDGNLRTLKDKTFRESKTTLFSMALKTCLNAHLDVLVDPNGPIAAPSQLREVVTLLFDTWVEKQ